VNAEILSSMALGLVAPGKGILAADESTSTIEKRLKGIGVVNSEENRRNYRELLFNAPGLGEYISGVILYEETIRQKTQAGEPFVELLRRQGIVPGIKVDKGTTALAGFPDKITDGLDGLGERLAEYAELGAKFTKWRAVIAITAEAPTVRGIRSNAESLARYAALAQSAGLVPIVEPEVLMDGDHPIERHYEATEMALHEVFNALFEHKVALEGMLLKPNMVLSGKSSGTQASVQRVASETLRCLKRNVPSAVPGIVFLSGGQGDVEATEHLNALNNLGPAPWELSFSYGRALQAPALNAWRGVASNVSSAQRALLLRARCNSAARSGKYSSAMEKN
jgi:fructose-bisphosphate aldolase class I